MTASIETFFLKVHVAIEVLDLLARVIEDKPKKKIRSGPQPSTSEHSPCRAACMCNLHRLNFPLENFFYKKSNIENTAGETACWVRTNQSQAQSEIES